MGLIYLIIFLSLLLILLLILVFKYYQAKKSLNKLVKLTELKPEEFEDYSFPNKEAEEIGEKILEIIKQWYRSKKKHELIKERNQALKREMTTNIAHELRTPVSSMMGYLEILKNQEELPLEKRQYFIERAYLQSVRLSELINDITLLTKIEESSNSFKIEEINLNQCFEEALKELQVTEKENIKINNMIFPSTKLMGNYNLVYSIFRNLIENSIKYAGENISLNIEIDEENHDFYYLSYFDTGVGIDPKNLDIIFDRFTRLDEGRSRKTGGSGLGLSIVKHAVQFHHGKIKAIIHPSGGLMFTFSLKRTVK